MTDDDKADDDLEAVRRYARELEERTYADWLRAVSSVAAGTFAAREMERTVSWRVTRPLRIVRSLQLRASRVGYRRAAGIAVRRMLRLRTDGTRGR